MTEQEFSKFYDDNIDKVFRFAYLRVSSAEIAQDLTAQVFLRFWQEIENPKKKINNHTAFLYRMLRNKIIDHYRRRDKHLVSLDKMSELADFQVAHKSFQQKIELTWEMKRIKNTLQNINPLYSDVIIWYYLEQFSYKEIANILQKKEGNIRVIVHRALQALKKELNKTPK